jgi:hypothetical protein
VIVFTHRLSLMVLLQSAAKQRANLDQPTVRSRLNRSPAMEAGPACRRRSIRSL